MSDDALQPPEGLRTYAEVVGGVLDHLRLTGVITDTEPGGIARTLVEAMAREMAEAYALLHQVYRAGFIDTAEGVALDHLVALLDVARIDGRASVGVVTFRRDPRVDGLIAIPRGTRVLLGAADRQVEFQTVDDERLPAGRQAATVQVLCPIADGTTVVAFDPAKSQVRLVDPIAGIGLVTLNEPTRERGHRENDDQLRERVKGLLEASGGGTAKAIEHAVLAVPGVTAVRLRESGEDDEIPKLQPGEFGVVVELEKGRELAPMYEQIEQAVLAAKGPGVHVRLSGVVPIALKMRLRLVPVGGTVDAELRTRIETDARTALRLLVEGLAVGETLSWNRVVAALLTVEGVADLGIGNQYACDSGGWSDFKAPISTAAPNQRFSLAEEDISIAVESRQPVEINLALTVSEEPGTALTGTLLEALRTHLLAVDAAVPRTLTHAGVLAALNAALEAGQQLAATDLGVVVFTVADQAEIVLQTSGSFTAYELVDDEVAILSQDPPKITVAGTP